MPEASDPRHPPPPAGRKQDPPDVAVVIVTHDTVGEVLVCLDSLGTGTGGVAEVVVVDTGSRDGTPVAVRGRHPDVRVVELANAGFGRGANAGVRVTSSPTAVVANADVRFPPEGVGGLVDALMRDDDLAMVGPAVRYPDGRPQASARRLPEPSTALGHAVLGWVAPNNRWTRRYRAVDLPDDRARDAEWLSGCALVVRRSAFEAVGGFDPGFHLYVEDLDLGVRLRDGGWRLRYVPSIVVEHRVGASTQQRRLWSRWSHARSLARYHRLHHDGPAGRALRPLIHVGLAAWSVLAWGAHRLAGSRRSATGEPTGG